ncbi:MAG: RDD family protein [Bacteroidia bacterium]|nr:RDD family protein [Bacteroidia bacterium]
MENIQISTTQNVNLNYKLAGIGPRMLAIIIDSIIRFSYIFVLYLIIFVALIRNWYSNQNSSDSGNEIMIGVLILLALPAFMYNLLCETFMNGQSFGKKIVKIKVVKLNGTQPNFGSYLIRSMFRIIDDGLIGLITIAATEKAQRLGDMVAGTTVIELNHKVTINDTILKEVKPDYTIVYPQVAMLSDSDANIIKEVMDFSASQEKPEHLKLLAEKIKKKYGISEVKQEDEAFLKTLLDDYSHYQFEK